MSQATLSRIERGQTRVDIQAVSRLARVLEISPADLIVLAERAFARTQAASAALAPSESDSWWTTALKVAGLVGFAGLAAYAVSALLEEPAKRGRRRAPR